jgi:hypothetical protein
MQTQKAKSEETVLSAVLDRLLPLRGAKPNYPAAKVKVTGRMRAGRLST